MAGSEAVRGRRVNLHVQLLLTNWGWLHLEVMERHDLRADDFGLHHDSVAQMALYV